MQTLAELGWNDLLQASFDSLELPDSMPARVIADFGSVLRVGIPAERKGEVSGRLLYEADHADLPKVGDWVAVRPLDEETVLVEAVVPRHTEISRKAAGEKAEKQVLAANVDVAFVVQAMDDDFNIGRLQRYLYQLQKSDIQPVLVLNKADKTNDPDSYTEKIDDLGIPYIVCSAATGQDVDKLANMIKPGQTAVLLGSSGVGKSTLTNQLLGSEVQKTQTIREDDSKGRHTTTHRELFGLKNGGLLIDTPGIRELQLWGTEEELQDAFDDIAQLATQCQFSNCRHGAEPGCAIQAALSSGELPKARYANYQKLQRELEFLKTKANPEALRQKKKDISKILRQHYKAQRKSPKRR